MTRFRLPLALLTGAMLVPLSAVAGPGESLQVVYHSGDDLTELMRRLAGEGAGVAELLDHNGVSVASDLKPGTALNIPVDWVEGWTRSHAEVLHVRGQVSARSADGSSLPLGVGMRLTPGDTVITGADGAAGLRIAGAHSATEHDHMQVRSGTELQIAELFEAKGGVRAGLLRLLRGAVEVVTGGSSDMQRRLEVETPTTIGGVRGTAFRVVVEGEAASTRIETLESTVFTAAQGSEVPVGARTGSRVRSGAAPEPVRPLPDEPALLAPQDEASLDAFAFRWQEVPDAASYVIEIALDEEFARVVYREPSAASQYDPGEATLPEHDGAFFWRVSAVDAEDFQGVPSLPWSFVLPPVE